MDYTAFKNVEQMTYSELQCKLRVAKAEGLTKVALNKPRNILEMAAKAVYIQCQGVKVFPISGWIKVIKIWDVMADQDYGENGYSRLTLGEVYEDDDFKMWYEEAEDGSIRDMFEFKPHILSILQQFKEVYEEFRGVINAPVGLDVNNPIDAKNIFDEVDINKLHEWGRVYWDIDFVEPCSLEDYAKWLKGAGHRVDMEDAPREAMETDRLDILAGLGIGFNPPIDRLEYWSKKLNNNRHHVFSPFKDWKWFYIRDIEKIFPEIDFLFTGEIPSLGVQSYLNLIQYGDPCEKPTVKMGCISFNPAKFGTNLSDETIALYRREFKDWHYSMLEKHGAEKMETLYQFFGSTIEAVEEIVSTLKGEWYEVLGVSPRATANQVKKAYTALMHQWHPDKNPSEIAHRNSQTIIDAYKQWKILHTS